MELLNERQGDRLQHYLALSPAQIDWLKLLAFAAMVGDHLNWSLQLANPWLMLMGRMVLPLFGLIWGMNLARRALISQASLNRLWFWAMLAQPAYWLAMRPAGFDWWNLNILFAFAVCGQCLRLVMSGGVLHFIAVVVILAVYLPLSETSYSLPGLMLLACSYGYFRLSAQSLRDAFAITWLASAALLNFGNNWEYCLAAIVLPVGVIALVRTGQLQSDQRFLSRNFFTGAYVAHLAILAVVASLLGGHA